VTAPRPKVLELVTLSAWGGAQGYVAALARHLRERYDVTVGCAPGGPLLATLRADGVSVVEIPTLTRTLNVVADLRTLAWLIAFMRRERFAIVHCHSTKAGLIGRVAARMAGVPGIVFTAHGWPFTSGWSAAVRVATTMAERVVARLTTTIVCVAEHVRTEAARLRIGRPGQLCVVHNGVDPGPWLAASHNATRDAAGGARVIMVGRLQPPKDPCTLIKAWARIPEPHHLVLVGDGPLRSEVAALVGDLGLAQRVTLLGARADVPEILAGGDVFALVTQWEGLPLAVIEAMMSGLPVVASDVGGVAEAVRDGQTGILVPAGDVDALAAALRSLLDDPQRRTRYGEAGRARALAHFTVIRMVDEIDRIYRSILDRAGRVAVRPA
jgi:glycosyltransferase involved in cell wall biosynthesis